MYHLLYRPLSNEKKYLEEETGVTYVNLEVAVAPQTEDSTKYIYTINYTCCYTATLQKQFDYNLHYCVKSESWVH